MASTSYICPCCIHQFASVLMISSLSLKCTRSESSYACSGDSYCVPKLVELRYIKQVDEARHLQTHMVMM